MDEIQFLPNLLAESVVAARGLHPRDYREFSDICDARCRKSYESGGWMLNVVTTNDRNELLTVIGHWLDAWLDNPRVLRR